jgi:Mitochondrial export protein Som1
MAPLVPVFHTPDLPSRIQIEHRAFKEKRRKGGPLDLDKCDLMELVQYSCNPPEAGIQAPGVVKCVPIVRLFRRYVFSTLLRIF